LREQQKPLRVAEHEQQDQIGGVLANVNELGHELKVLAQRQEKLQADEAAISETFKNETDPIKIVELADKYRQSIDENKQKLDKTLQMIGQINEKRNRLKQQLKDLRSQLMENQKQLQDYERQQEAVQAEAATANESRNQQIETLSEQLTDAES